VPRSLFEKIWDRHVVARRAGQVLLYVDRHIVHDSGFHARVNLGKRGLKVRRPQNTFGTPDHYVPTISRDPADAGTPEIRRMVEAYPASMKQHGIPHVLLGDERQGIVHIIGPELGITQPGMVLVCGDSHTSTHGALGALAFGIGQSENEHVLATQTLWQAPQKTMRILIEGARPAGVTAKDVILAIIAKIGAGGAVGHVIEYAGAAVRAMSIEERLTLCNMSIEAGARAGMVAPDDTTYQYLGGRPFAPKDFDVAVKFWKTLPSDPDAVFDRETPQTSSPWSPGARARRTRFLFRPSCRARPCVRSNIWG
jgi:3-isopropylmalate/(R)-2-methylmalate dehydratase large subunit